MSPQKLEVVAATKDEVIQFYQSLPVDTLISITGARVREGVNFANFRNRLITTFSGDISRAATILALKVDGVVRGALFSTVWAKEPKPVWEVTIVSNHSGGGTALMEQFRTIHPKALILARVRPDNMASVKLAMKYCDVVTSGLLNNLANALPEDHYLRDVAGKLATLKAPGYEVPVEVLNEHYERFSVEHLGGMGLHPKVTKSFVDSFSIGMGSDELIFPNEVKKKPRQLSPTRLNKSFL